MTQLIHFRENMRRISSLFRDRPQNALDTACYWIEYVIRNGKDVLRSPAMELTWWQVSLLDVYAVTIFGLIMIIYASILVLRNTIKLMFCWRKKEISSSKKNS